MSLRAPLFYRIPEQTAQVARAAFPKGNPSMRMRDALGPISTNPAVAHRFPNNGQPAHAPAQLALVTIMQFAEGRSDEQTATAVRGRIDGKYALALPLTDPGFAASVLSAFRTRLVVGNAELLLFETMLTLFREQKLVKARGKQRTDRTHVLAALQVLNRLACVGETVRHALNQLATEAPDWLQAWVPSVWFDRYRRRFEAYRLPADKPARAALAEQIGADGRLLLPQLSHPDAPVSLRERSAAPVLRQVWLQQCSATPTEPSACGRSAEDVPPAPLLMRSPYDPDARSGKKRRTEWTGYKVHLSETCDADTPQLITDVLTTPATTSDFDVLPIIQQQVAARDLVPSEQIVDSGYATADHLLTSEANHAMNVIGPIATDHSWQAKASQGFAAAQFVIDWEQACASCPQGKRSAQWLPRTDEDTQVSMQITFAKADCAACAVRAQCTPSKSLPRRLQVRDQAHYEVLQAARQRQKSALFKVQ